jgi:glutaconate CoA-transferase, subunit B
MSDVSRQELLIHTIGRLLKDCRSVAVGASSPIPGAGALLARHWAASEHPARRLFLTILGSSHLNAMTGGGVELFDMAAQGRVEAFFLGGGQIDGAANINLVGAGGHYPQTTVRWPGSFGSAYLYFLVPRVILFREEHSPRVLVDKVDYVSAPGTSEGVMRRGGPSALMTGMALFSFDADRKRFALRSVHRGASAADVRANTGFDYDSPPDPPQTAAPEAATLDLLRGRVTHELAETYPTFAEVLRNESAAA